MKRRKLIINVLILALLPASCWATASGAQEDLFARNKSDSAIKMLVFPLSLAVMENRPLKGLYYFYAGEKEKFNGGLSEDVDSIENPIYQILSDAAVIRKTLVKTDPTRVAPSKRQKDLLGPVSKAELKNLCKIYETDMALVFRREIHLQSGAALPESLFEHPDELLNQKNPIDIKIKSRAMLYLAKQNKILMILSNEQSMTVTPSETAKTELQDLAKMGLHKLAAQTKKTIRDNQFTIRRSNY